MNRDDYNNGSHHGPNRYPHCPRLRKLEISQSQSHAFRWIGQNTLMFVQESRPSQFSLRPQATHRLMTPTAYTILVQYIYHGVAVVAQSHKIGIHLTSIS